MTLSAHDKNEKYLVLYEGVFTVPKVGPECPAAGAGEDREEGESAHY
jgi:hypothetical protein